MVQRAVERLYERMLGDPELAPFFAGVDMKAQHEKMGRFLGLVCGGRNDLHGPDLRAAHARLVEHGLADRHFDATCGHLEATLISLGVDPEAVDDVLAIVESTREDVLGRRS